jgi:hypothetical protein
MGGIFGGLKFLPAAVRCAGRQILLRKKSPKMYCFCTAGLPIRAILAISEEVISAMGEPLQLLIFPVLVAK